MNRSPFLFPAIVIAILSSTVVGQTIPMPGHTPSPMRSLEDYVLGPNDQVIVQVVELPEFSNKTYRVESNGMVDLPLIGDIPANGLTVGQFRDALTKQLRQQVREPHVMVSVAETKSQAVSVMGEVSQPGTQTMDGPKTLFDVLAGAGGLKTDAGSVITITRHLSEGQLSLPDAVVNQAAGTATGEVTVHAAVELRDPAANIVMRPHDEVFVPRSRLLYVIGNVRKPGGFTMSGKRTVSALEALSLAEGLSPNAAPASARILRKTDETGTTREQIKVNLKRILAGKEEDIGLRPDDILFVPDSTARRFAARAAETALATVSGIIIWRGI